ncbi:MAG: hypothetical protein SPH93_14300 [Clostridium sp.]|uniref:hypothetical protein n=1 Tax=Clostridium sp. TaxID=1506 RepID=UPI002A919976|nr:hypothetical protein [Clostridium sp.]MDY6228808.1 hypothetical protein [Clostridium sp.]
MKKIKKSIDFTEDNLDLMTNHIKINNKKNLTMAINELIDTFIIEDKEIKLSLSKFLKDELTNLNNMIIDVNTYSGIKKCKQKKSYIKLIKFLDNDNTIELENSDEEFQNQIFMRQIKISNGYINIPKEWIILNEDEANNCTYVIVIEVIRCGRAIEHCIYFSKFHIENISFNELEEIKSSCRKKINLNDSDLKLEVHLIPEYKNNILNYPYGAFIFRNKIS